MMFARWQAQMHRKTADRWEKWPVQMTAWTLGLSATASVLNQVGRRTKEKELTERITRLERNLDVIYDVMARR